MRFRFFLRQNDNIFGISECHYLFFDSFAKIMFLTSVYFVITFLIIKLKSFGEISFRRNSKFI